MPLSRSRLAASALGFVALAGVLALVPVLVTARHAAKGAALT